MKIHHILTLGVTINFEGAVERVATGLSTDLLSTRLPLKLNGGETRKIELSYVVFAVTLLSV